MNNKQILFLALLSALIGSSVTVALIAFLFPRIMRRMMLRMGENGCCPPDA